MTCRISTEECTPTDKSVYLFDSNIWMFFYLPTMDSSQGTALKYSEFFGKILSVGGRIITSHAIISECANRLIREHKRIHCRSIGIDPKDLSDKEYRKTASYIFNIQTVRNNLADILNVADLVPYESSKEDFLQCLDFKDNESLDVTDRIIEQIAIKSSAQLVTHDGDFLDSPCEIVTSNRKLLR